MSSFNSILGMLKACNRFIRPAYLDDDWEELLYKVEIDSASGRLIKASADSQESFNKLVFAPYSDSIRIFTDGSVVCWDSISAIRCFENRFADPQGLILALKIGHFLSRAFLQGSMVSFLWNPAHVGIEGNQRTEH